MSEISQQQRHFLQNYLGIEIASLVDRDLARIGAHVPAVPLWQDAKDKVDAQLQLLSDVLRKSGDPDLSDVAGEVETLLEPVRVSLLGALAEYDKAPESRPARDQASDAVGAARGWLVNEPRVAAVDGNPWGVPMAVEATIGGALDRIDSSILGYVGATE